MRNYMIGLVAIAMIVLSGCSVPPPPEDTPAPVVPAPVAPVTDAPIVESPVDLVDPLQCEMDCATQCDTDAESACSLASDYNMCVDNCGDIIRSEGCKGACASLNPIECGIIFRGECVDMCMDKCA